MPPRKPENTAARPAETPGGHLTQVEPPMPRKAPGPVYLAVLPHLIASLAAKGMPYDKNPDPVYMANAKKTAHELAMELQAEWGQEA